MRNNLPRSRRTRSRSSLIAWILFFLAPIAAMLLLLSHVGGRWLNRGAIRYDGAAIIPGFTMETAPAPHRPPSPRSQLVITSVQSNSQATRHGIAVGDTVVAIDGARIFSLDQARRTLHNDRGATVALRLAHGRRLRDVRLVRPKPALEGERHGPQAARHRG
jgi:membrane-associated protease RseP (regulator of RpoE activity)